MDFSFAHSLLPRVFEWEKKAGAGNTREASRAYIGNVRFGDSQTLPSEIDASEARIRADPANESLAFLR